MNKTLASVLAIAVIASGAFYFARDSKEVTGPKTHEVMLHIENEKLVSGPALLQVKKGDAVEITVMDMTDSTEEFHLHGYDKSINLKKGKEATLTLVVDTAGRFEAELENAGTEIFTLEVTP